MRRREGQRPLALDDRLGRADALSTSPSVTEARAVTRAVVLRGSLRVERGRQRLELELDELQRAARDLGLLGRRDREAVADECDDVGKHLRRVGERQHLDDPRHRARGGRVRRGPRARARSANGAARGAASRAARGRRRRRPGRWRGACSRPLRRAPGPSRRPRGRRSRCSGRGRRARRARRPRSAAGPRRAARARRARGSARRSRRARRQPRRTRPAADAAARPSPAPRR